MKKGLSLIVLTLLMALRMSGAYAAEPYDVQKHYTSADLLALEGTKVLVNTKEGVSFASGGDVYYEAPLAIYMNGTAGQIKRVLRSDGPYGLFAEVEVGSHENGGAYVEMPLMNLAPYETGNELIQYKGTVLAHTPLLSDVDSKSESLGILEKGMIVAILARYERFYHVQAGSDMGFVAIDRLELDAVTQKVMDGNLPASFSHTTMADEMKRKRISEAYFAFADTYGERYMWPFEVKMEFQKLQESAYPDGDSPFGMYNSIAPNQSDMSEADAITRAKEVFIETCGISPNTAEAFLAYVDFKLDRQPLSERRIWDIRFERKDKVLGIDQFFRVEILSPSGEVVSKSEKEYALSPATGSDTLVGSGDEVFYDDTVSKQNRKAQFEALFGPEYTWSLDVRSQLWNSLNAVPDKRAISQEDAYLLAKEALEGSFGLSDEALAQYNSYYYYERKHVDLWRVVFYDYMKLGQNVLSGYEVIFNALNGKLIAATQLKESVYTYANAEVSVLEKAFDYDAAIKEWEETRGKFIYWSIEEKYAFAQAYPESGWQFGLPQEGELTQEEARDMAIAVMKAASGVTDNEIETFGFAYFFETDPWLGPPRTWRIDADLLENQVDGVLHGYEVILDAKTGALLRYNIPSPQSNG